MIPLSHWGMYRVHGEWADRQWLAYHYGSEMTAQDWAIAEAKLKAKYGRGPRHD